MYDKEGGPAFPILASEPGGGTYAEHAGMSVRTWLTGRALTGLCANPAFMGWPLLKYLGDSPPSNTRKHKVTVINELALEIAKAQLAILELEE